MNQLLFYYYFKPIKMKKELFWGNKKVFQAIEKKIFFPFVVAKTISMVLFHEL